MRYCALGEFAALQAEAGNHILGAVGFGAGVRGDPSVTPSAWIDLPVLGGSGAPVIETWLSHEPVDHDGANATLRSSNNTRLLFGCLQTPIGADMAAAAEHAYLEIFRHTAAREFPHLLRIWNYFPGINADDAGLERYQRFSLGRHAAFDRAQAHARMPAASALGTRDGPLTVYFLAARQLGRPLENPRQLSAYCYPVRYGPRSPLFSRAMQCPTDAASAFFISGTASIVGHETRHAGDVLAQTQELLANIDALATLAGPAATGWQLKAYLRHAADLPAVRQRLQTAFAPDTPVIYLQADVCRSSLLVEVEGVSFPDLDRLTLSCSSESA